MLRISNGTAALEASALVAVLAGCSGVSQYAPTGNQGVISAQSTSRVSTSASVRLMGKYAPPFASQQANYVFYHRQLVNLNAGQFIVRNKRVPPPCGGGPLNRIYASDNVTGDLDTYCEDAPGTPVTIVGVAGWGLAVSPDGNPGARRLAVGQTGGTIKIYSVPGLVPQATTLVLSGMPLGYNAYGICWDDAGGLYATDWPSNTIDHWTAAGVTSGGGPDGGTIATTRVTEDYYLACDFDSSEPGNHGYLMVYGFNTNSLSDDSDVARVALPAGPDTVVATLGNLATSTGFPGGLAIKANDHLIANNQFGFMYDLGNVEPWGPPVRTCTWAFPTDDFTSITFDNSVHQKEIWASNIGSGTVSSIQSFAYPLVNNAPCVTPGPSGGPSIPITGEQYVGVAAARNRGD